MFLHSLLLMAQLLRLTVFFWWIVFAESVPGIETVNVSVFGALLLECGSRLISNRQNGVATVWNRNGTILENGMNVSV